MEKVFVLESLISNLRIYDSSLKTILNLKALHTQHDLSRKNIKCRETRKEKVHP